MKKFTFAVLLLAGSLSTLAQLPDPILINEGLIAGKKASNSNVMVYRGIPYAAPPIANNRWRPPEPPASWSGIRDATNFGPRCVQGGFAPGAIQPLSSEDCLYLNVFTPANSQDELLPVMMWIHGGGFFTGTASSNQYDSQHLAAKGAVVVTINYRLGTFGFFAHPELTEESPNNSSGNYAMLDAIAALEWIYENVAAFGGDPTNVTVFGESAGGVAVSALTASPLARGLVHRAILQSQTEVIGLGFTSSPQPTLAEAEAAGLQQMEAFGASSLAELREASAQAILENFPTGGRVIVDGWFLPKQIAQVYEDNDQHPIYLMAGSNRDEANFFGIGAQSLQQYEQIAGELFGDLAEEFKALYPATDAASADLAIKQAYNDEMAWLPRKLAKHQADWGFSSYVYFFDRVPPGTSRGATHVAELAYVFNQWDQHPEWHEADRALGNAMSQYFVNFARSSRVNGQGLPAWPGFIENETGNVIILGEEIRTESEMVPSSQVMEFFDQVHQSLLE